ncbi:MAG TPA: DUF397 domain-containing protein [Mycobacteriales bacterium]|nr:DUF397 domain-containing protein [Mycobacteriales bacterium]
MTPPDWSRARWRKSTYSGNDNGCVEFAELGGGRVGVRDTKDRGHGPVLVFGGPAWTAFVHAVKAGDVDRG